MKKNCLVPRLVLSSLILLAYSPTFFCFLPFSLSHILSPYLFPPSSPVSSSLSASLSISYSIPPSLSLPSSLPYPISVPSSLPIYFLPPSLSLTLSLFSLTPSLLNPLLFSSLPISQRSWGVPIPVFYKKSTNEALMNAEILEHVEGTYYLYGILHGTLYGTLYGILYGASMVIVLRGQFCAEA